MARRTKQCCSEKHRRKVAEQWVYGLETSSISRFPSRLVISIYYFSNPQRLYCFFRRHEHLYRGISNLMIRSDELTSRGFNASATLQRSQVILCTLSMLSSIALKRSGILRVVPIKTMVVDEASQIEIGDYIAVFTEHKSIRKVCFIGDDKQCGLSLFGYRLVLADPHFFQCSTSPWSRRPSRPA